MRADRLKILFWDDEPCRAIDGVGVTAREWLYQQWLNLHPCAL